MWPELLRLEAECSAACGLARAIRGRQCSAMSGTGRSAGSPSGGMTSLRPQPMASQRIAAMVSPSARKEPTVGDAISWPS